MNRLTLLYLLTFLLLPACRQQPLTITRPEPAKDNGECVVLVHGMARSSSSLEKMQYALTSAGYHTVNLNYPSTDEKIEVLADRYLPPAIEKCKVLGRKRVHFVTHSLGGIVVRSRLAGKKPEKLGHVVMLSPPNQGSEVTDALKKWWLYSRLNGPAGRQLGTAPDSLPNRLGPVDYPVGIITGDTHAFFDFWLSSYFKGKNDGKVSVERAKVEGMRDFLVVHRSHPFIMDADEVIAATLAFLQNGSFSK
ncbi:esterase/lipase family protein [Desulfomarina sp.]